MVERGCSEYSENEMNFLQNLAKEYKGEDFERYKYLREEVEKVIRDAKLKHMMTFTIS